MTPPTRNLTAKFAFKTGADVFSPDVLVQMGRPGAGVANERGDIVLSTYAKFSLKDRKNNKSVYLVPLESTAKPLQIPLPNGGELFWLDSRTLAHAVEADGKLDLYALNLKFETSELTSEAASLIGSFPTTSATNFQYSASSGVLVFSDNVHADGDLNKVKENDEAWEKRGDTALVYDETYERHWDTWQGPKKPSLFSVALQRGADKKWSFGSTFDNLLRGTGHHSPVEPFGGTDDFSVAGTSVLYTTKDPILPQGWHTKQNVYLVSTSDPGNPKELTSGKQGATHSPVLNSDGSKAAWLELAEDGYEADKANIVIYDLKKNVRFTLIEKWDRSPEAISFSLDGKLLYFTAGDNARVKLFALPIPPTPESSSATFAQKYQTPVALVKNGAVSGVQPLPNGRLLFSRNSLTTPNDVYVIRDLNSFESELVSSDSAVEFKGLVEQVSHFTADDLDGKSLDEGEEFWFKGALNKDIQGWVLKPKGFSKNDNKKWPALLLIHGGPQGAWEDQWSTRWNPNIFAQQGYFTVMINPTGSTTFGQELTDAIAEDWGGKPFVDLIAGWKYILDAYPQIDTDRLVAAGASWGGYAINWIQGHPEYGFNFKALVCHDGVFDSVYNGYSTEELYFFNHEWGGRPWEEKSKKLLEQMTPSNYVHKWSTPQLLIHGSKDYRLAETESIGAFHALQQLGVPTRLVIFPDENHWVLKHGNSLKWHYEVLRWFEEFVGNA
ncbi:Dipeptidyl-peptidase 5 [Mycena indigotica]|uniref:Dipeptidyl-peptidase V n=1 Tax=Mycena indigotica TaxID=2126181 RepID=A0A8H6SHF8_9AGAR|nr:Dipeptidyl-peptidase 5 [Mycena indigotica]KAF7298860.1 Dipeptidyl-peptidase 5 [Mycena indigotica]